MPTTSSVRGETVRAECGCTAEDGSCQFFSLSSPRVSSKLHRSCQTRDMVDVTMT